MEEGDITLPIPKMESFSGDINDVVTTIAKNLQIITQSINTIRVDQHALFTRYIPGIQSAQEIILNRQQEILEKHNEILKHIEGISEKTKMLEELADRIESIDDKIETMGEPISVATRANKIRYCEKEITEEEMGMMTRDELSRLKRNISSSKWKYGRERKQEAVNMCTENMNRINAYIMRRK